MDVDQSDQQRPRDHVDSTMLPSMEGDHMNQLDRIFEQPRFKTGPSQKVLAAVWNPKQTVVALAMSNGEIIVKRQGWHTCWRQEVSDMVGVCFEPTKEPDSLPPEQISAMCFSPDGEYLVVNLANGRTHFFATNTGKVAYTMEAQPFFMMKWVTVLPVDEEYRQFKRKLPTHKAFTFNPEGSKEALTRIRDVEHFLLTAVPITYRGTMLIGAMSSSKMFMYANGILLMKELDLLDHYKLHGMVDPSSLKVIDFLIVQDKRSLNVTYQYVENDVAAYVDDETGLPRQQSTDPIVGTTTMLVDYNLGWGILSYVRSMYNIAANYSEMLYCLIFIKEMLRYTATGYEDSAQAFVERFLEITVRNYKLTGGHRDGFFIEMVKHLKGEIVSNAFIESVRRLKNAPSLKTYMAPFNDYITKRLHYIKYGISKVHEITGQLMDIAQLNLDHTIHLFERGNRSRANKQEDHWQKKRKQQQPEVGHVPPVFGISSKPRLTGPIEDYYDFIADIATFQWQLERFIKLIDVKRTGMEAFSHYIHEILRPAAEQMPHFTLDMHNYDLGELINFIAETQRFDPKFKSPSHLVPNVFSVVPKVNTPVKAEEIFQDILQFAHPFGVFEVPAYVAQCSDDCPHMTEIDTTEEAGQVRNGLQANKIYASVYQWHTDKYFDFFAPYFPEYCRDGGVPPPEAARMMRDKLKNENKPPIESFRRFAGPGVPQLPSVDPDDLVVRLALRPTFFLGMMPLFNFRHFAEGYYGKKNPRPVCPKIHILEKTHPDHPMKVLMNDALQYYAVDMKSSDMLNVPRHNNQQPHPDSIVVIIRNKPNGVTLRAYVYYPMMPPPSPEVAAGLPPVLSWSFASIRGNQWPIHVNDITMNANGVLVGVGRIDAEIQNSRVMFSPPSSTDPLPVLNVENLPVKLFWMNVFGKSVLVESQELELSGEPGDFYNYIFASQASEHAVLISKQLTRLLWMHTIEGKSDVSMNTSNATIPPPKDGANEEDPPQNEAPAPPPPQPEPEPMQLEDPKLIRRRTTLACHLEEVQRSFFG